MAAAATWVPLSHRCGLVCPEAAVAEAVVGLVPLCRVEAVTFCNKVP